MTQFTQFVSGIKKHGIAKNSHFFCGILPPAALVAKNPTTNDIIPFYIENVSIPEFALATRTVKDAGLNREVVYDKMYGTITVTMFSDQNMTIKKFFDDWAMSAVRTKGGTFTYPTTYTAESMAIYQVDNAKMVSYVTVLNNIYPKIIDDVQLSADGKGPLSFRVQFTYESWESIQVNTTDTSNKIGDNPLSSLRNAFDLIQLVRSGANKDAVKSLLINVGVKKLTEAIGSSGAVSGIAKTVDSILGASGIGRAIGSLKGIVL